MPTRTEQTRALLLRSVDYRDADRVVTLLTEQFGKVSALARSARRSQKRFGGALQPYVVFRAAIRPGKGELAILDRVEAQRPFLKLLKDLDAIAAAGHGLQLIRELCPEREPDAVIFQLAVDFLSALDEGFPIRETALQLQAKLLGRLGVAPLLERCTKCGKQPNDEQPALYDPVAGGIVCRACGGGPFRLAASSRAQWQASITDAAFGSEPWAHEVRTELGQVLDRSTERYTSKPIPGRWETGGTLLP